MTGPGANITLGDVRVNTYIDGWSRSEQRAG